MSSFDSASDYLQKQVVDQLEHYFSDINLKRDPFLRRIMNNDINAWVSVETLMNFNRLKSMVNNNKSLLIRIFNTMESDLIELSPNGDRIRRRLNRPLSQTDGKSLEERTVLLKGIPKETTSDELLEWAQQLGPILEVRPLKTYKHFNGSALVTFAIKESAEKVVNQSVLKFKDIELSKEFYLKSPIMG